MKYTEPKMADYPMPYEINMTINVPKSSFNKNAEKCVCEKYEENMKHIYSCENLNNGHKNKTPFE